VFNVEMGQLPFGGGFPVGGWLTGSAIMESVKTGDIVISPFSENAVNPNSYNYTLGHSVLRLTSDEIDLLAPDDFEKLPIPEDGLVLMPGECYLGHTDEVFGSNMFASLVTGRSSIDRKFITNHVTAGLIDVGFFGQITLEIVVQKPTRVYGGIPFGQIFWFSLCGPPSPLYTGKYQGQAGPTQSRMALDGRKCGGSSLASRPAAQSPNNELGLDSDTA
jgi:dCTP deaminase